MAVAAPRARPARAHEAPGERRARPRRAAASSAARPRLARGVIGIAVIAALLAGIVALQVSVLELRMERGRLESEILELRGENARIESEISSAASVSRVSAAARRLGLVDPESTTYVRAPARRG